MAGTGAGAWILASLAAGRIRRPRMAAGRHRRVGVGVPCVDPVRGTVAEPRAQDGVVGCGSARRGPRGFGDLGVGEAVSSVGISRMAVARGGLWGSSNPTAGRVGVDLYYIGRVLLLIHLNRCVC